MGRDSVDSVVSVVPKARRKHKKARFLNRRIGLSYRKASRALNLRLVPRANTRASARGVRLGLARRFGRVGRVASRFGVLIVSVASIRSIRSRRCRACRDSVDFGASISVASRRDLALRSRPVDFGRVASRPVDFGRDLACRLCRSRRVAIWRSGRVLSCRAGRVEVKAQTQKKPDSSIGESGSAIARRRALLTFG